MAEVRDYKGAGRQLMTAVAMARSAEECDRLIAFCDEAEPRAGILNRRRFESARQVAEHQRDQVMAMSG